MSAFFGDNKQKTQNPLYKHNYRVYNILVGEIMRKISVASYPFSELEVYIYVVRFLKGNLLASWLHGRAANEVCDFTHYDLRRRIAAE